MAVKQRNITLDIARVLAVLAVVMIHTSASFVTSYGQETVEFSVGNVFDSVARVGVPLFIMISGALMLDENRTVTVGSILRKNVKGVLLLLAFWTIVYAVVYKIVIPMRDGTAISVRAFLEAVLLGHFHMWYLYMIVGLYLATPFLRAFVKKDNQQLVLLFLVIALVAQFIPTVCTAASELTDIWPRSKELAYVPRLMDQFSLSFFGQYAAYYVMGWYIVHVGFSTHRWKKYALYCAGVLSLVGTIWFVQVSGDYDNGYSNLNLLIFLYASGVFALLNSIRWRLSKSVQHVVVMLSKLSFGVYIVHLLVLTLVQRTVPYSHAPVLYIIGSYIVVLVASFVITFVISKLPATKFAVRM